MTTGEISCPVTTGKDSQPRDNRRDFLSRDNCIAGSILWINEEEEEEEGGGGVGVGSGHITSRSLISSTHIRPEKV